MSAPQVTRESSDFELHLDGDQVVKVVRHDRNAELTRTRERLLEHEHRVMIVLARDRRARHHVPSPGTLTRLADGRLALTRPKVVGTSLAEVVERALVRSRFQGARRWNGATRDLVGAILDAVEALHRAGWVHNDLKPEDILVQVDAGRFHVVLLDLGLAAPSGRSGSGGTVVWAAPERLAGAPGTFKSDVWSLGAILYLVMTGRPPYPEGDDGITNAVDARLARQSPLDAPRDQAAVLAWQDLGRHGQAVGVDLQRALLLATSSTPKRRPGLPALRRMLGLAGPTTATSSTSARSAGPTPHLRVPVLALIVATTLGVWLGSGPVSRALGLSREALQGRADPVSCQVVAERAERLCRRESDPARCVEVLTRTDDCRERAALLGACGGG